MTATVTHLRPCATDPATVLRYIADQYAAGEFGGSHITLVIAGEVYHAGTLGDGESVCNALWDLETGKAKIMQAALEAMR